MLDIWQKLLDSNMKLTKIAAKKRKRARAILFRVIALMIGLVLALLFTEIGLQIYNPFYSTVKGDRIVLRANRTFVYDGAPEYGTDEEVTYRTNSLGFRGPELTPEHDLKIVTIGGSTTNSLTLNEESTWSGQLYQRMLKSHPDSWLNNAGFVGHTSFAHIQLLQDHVLPLKPDYVVLLVGINDLGQIRPSPFDRDNLRGLDINSVKGFVKSLSCYSETVALGINLVRWKRAMNGGLPYHGMHIEEFEHIQIETTQAQQQRLQRHREEFIPGYRERIEAIVRSCEEHDTQLVLVTQPALFGPGVDDVSKISLETLKLPYEGETSGMTHWETLELYNDVLRDIGHADDLLVVDLAAKLPKSSSLFYDWIHFSKSGSSRIANIIWDDLESKLMAPNGVSDSE